jgi:cephalosporin-C deacetylase-like acetyl esterase
MTNQKQYHKTRYQEYKNRNYLTQEYIKARNCRGEFSFGTIVDVADRLDEKQTKWLLSIRYNSDDPVSDAVARCVHDAYAMGNLSYDVRQWIEEQAANIGASFGDIVKAIIEDVYEEEHKDD